MSEISLWDDINPSRHYNNTPPYNYHLMIHPSKHGTYITFLYSNNNIDMPQAVCHVHCWPVDYPQTQSSAQKNRPDDKLSHDLADPSFLLLLLLRTAVFVRLSKGGRHRRPRCTCKQAWLGCSSMWIACLWLVTFIYIMIYAADDDKMPGQCCATVRDGGPALTRHLVRRYSNLTSHYSSDGLLRLLQLNNGGIAEDAQQRLPDDTRTLCSPGNVIYLLNYISLGRMIVTC